MVVGAVRRWGGGAGSCEPDGDGEPVVAGGRFDVDDGGAVEPGLVEPVAELIVGEAEAAVRRGSEEVVAVRSEVDDEQLSAGGDQLGCLSDGAGRVVEIVEHLVDDDEVERRPVEGRAVDVTLAQLPALDAEAFEVGAGNRQHGMARVEADGAIRPIAQQGEHAARSGPDVEHTTERAVADGVEDGSFDRAGGGVQRPFLVPDRCDTFEVLARCFGAAGPDRLRADRDRR